MTTIEKNNGCKEMLVHSFSCERAARLFAQKTKRFIQFRNGIFIKVHGELTDGMVEFLDDWRIKAEYFDAGYSAQFRQ